MKVKSSGFTFIELLIAIGIIGFAIPVIVSLFLVSVRTQARIAALREVKNNGDFAMLQIQSLIRRYARSIHSANPGTAANEVCNDTNPSFTPSTGETLYFKDLLGNTFSFNEVTNAGVIKLASASASQTYYLTNAKVNVGSWSVSCSKSSIFSKPLVNVSYVVSSTFLNNGQPAASLNFQTTISLRN